MFTKRRSSFSFVRNSSTSTPQQLNASDLEKVRSLSDDESPVPNQAESHPAPSQSALAPSKVEQKVRGVEEQSMLIRTARRLSTRGFNLAHGDFYLDIADVVKGPQIGAGAFSKVYVGRYFGDLVAIKILQRKRDDMEKYILRELELVQNLQHPNILSYVGACDTPPNSGPRGMWEAPPPQAGLLYLITEYAVCGNLHSLLTNTEVSLGWKFRMCIARDVAAAMKHIHDKHVIHRDIKAENVLLGEDFKPKLSDFGLARVVPNENEKQRMSLCGTDSHMAPELKLDEEYNTQADVFSFGVLLAEIITRKQISKGPEDPNQFLARQPANFFEMNLEELRAVCEGTSAPASLVELVCQCCEPEPEMRPSANDILEWLLDLVDETPPDILPPPQTSAPPQVGDLTLTHHKQPLASTDMEANSMPLSFPAKTRILEEQAVVDEHVIAEKRGWLFKRKIQGLRLWRKRWFVLDPAEGILSWYNSPEEEGRGQGRGSLSLKRTVLVRGIGFRFQILRSEDVADGHESRMVNENRELGAANAEVLADWLLALQKVISAWELQATELGKEGRRDSIVNDVPGLGTVSQNHIPASPEPLAMFRDRTINKSSGISTSFSKKKLSLEESEAIKQFMIQKAVQFRFDQARRFGRASPATVEDWLVFLDLPELAETFQQHGYTSLQQIKLCGLTPADFDYLGIVNPMYRRTLQLMAQTHFSPFLRTTIDSYKSFGGVTVFSVHAVYKCWQSNVGLRYSDFVKLNGALKVSSKRPGRTKNSKPLQLPALPGKGVGQLLQREKTVEFKDKRREELGQYLEGVVALVDDGAHPDEMDVLLKHLALDWVVNSSQQ
eukprot:c10998_g1_i1.p1 GENE.c10998_g1_i1~~c10998_g1_i1.p1  ORF type:complete len:857 (-),score=212.59 c10998_g1_i1:398-2911(-)